jgi:predicted acyltransferase (DUF342 family)
VPADASYILLVVLLPILPVMLSVSQKQARRTVCSGSVRQGDVDGAGDEKNLSSDARNPKLPIRSECVDTSEYLGNRATVSVIRNAAQDSSTRGRPGPTEASI